MLGLYDPDRSQSVTLKGSPKSWGDFVKGLGASCHEAHAADGGAGLAVLSESFSSPTLARLASDLRARYPRLQWATYDAVSDENRLAGVRAATGRDVDLMLRLDQAAVILALDADPLLTDPEMIRHTRGFAAGRRAGARSRLGAAVRRRDEPALRGRRRLLADGSHGRPSAPSARARQIAPFLAALAARLAAPAGAGSGERGTASPGRRLALDRRPRQGPSGEPRQGAHRGRRTPASAGPCRGLRAEHVSRQHRQDRQLLRDKGCVASERECAGVRSSPR